MAATTSAAGASTGVGGATRLLTRQDKIVLGLAVGIPAFIHISPGVGPDHLLGHPVVHELERHRRARARSSSSASRTT